jgi:hypothetical protein
VFSKAAAISVAGSLPSSGESRWRRTAGKSDRLGSGMEIQNRRRNPKSG